MLHTVDKYQIALTGDDDETCVQTDGITNLARGYLA